MKTIGGKYGALRSKRALFIFPAFLALVFVFSACGSPPNVKLNLSAASSLRDTLSEINSLYLASHPGISLSPNFAGSGTLQTQIENGAPCDVFIPASPAQMDNLQKQELILKETRRDLLNNKVVLIVGSDNPLSINSFADLGSARVKRIAVGDPKSVPVGSYAQQVFDELGLSAQVQPKLVLGGDVRTVLTYVESGNVDAGVVYSTDALTSNKVSVAASAPEDINARVIYPVAVMKASQNPQEAREYIDYLFGPEAQKIFEKYGFSPLKRQ